MTDRYINLLDAACGIAIATFALGSIFCIIVALASYTVNAH